MNNHEAAKEIIKNIEGTLIADLNSLIHWTKELKRIPPDNNLGKLNFTLALISLIACETLGFYILGAQEHNKNKKSDVGIYIIQFIEKYFPQKNCFKYLSKVLADFLRHALVHGFGSYSPKVPYDIGVFIDIDIKNEIKATTENGKKIIYINSIALAERTIEAFYRLKEEVNNSGLSSELIENIIKARDLNMPVDKKALKQFEVVYKYAEKHGMTIN